MFAMAHNPSNVCAAAQSAENWRAKSRQACVAWKTANRTKLPVVANRGESENWVGSATIATALSFARTWSKELAAAVVFLVFDESGDIAGMNLC
jgi:hypothetical protein